MTIFIIFMLILVSAVTIGSKLFFLTSRPEGILVVYANVFYETFSKKMAWERWPIDAGTALVLTVAWWVAACPYAGILFLLTYVLSWTYALREDQKIVNSSPGEQDLRMGKGSADRRSGGWVPAPNPRLITILQGPVWERGKIYDLGDWPQGHCADYKLLILNPTVLRASFPLKIQLNGAHNAIAFEQSFESSQRAPLPGEYVLAPFRLTATALSNSPTEIHVKVGVGGYEIKQTLRVKSVFDSAQNPVQSVDINRWKGGARAGFAWRGDMDMYDPTTFQSVEGLRHTLEVCRRYRVASSMYLSGRLSLVKEEHERFCKHLGVDRHTDGIDDFIRFMKEEVSIAPILDFPYSTERPFAMELGNHMYLHYDTHAAMDPGNNWKNMAKAGEGRYPWQTEETGSLAEQRDNARHNTRIIEETLGVTPSSWAVPGRGFDAYTSRAVEAAGFEVGSDTNASAWVNVLKLPPPHHPKGTKHLVEMTKKYPGDPDNAYKVAMLKYWIYLARKRRQTFVFMAHQHLLRYEGIAGTHCAEAILRHILADCKGNFYVTTVYGLGWYWERVLCPEHRRVSVEIKDAHTITVHNNGDDALDGIPVEVAFSNGGNLLVLADLPVNGSVDIDLIQSPTRSVVAKSVETPDRSTSEAAG